MASRTRLTRPVFLAAGVTATLAALVGLLLGVGGFTFVYANGASYLRDDPRACANCHVMQEQFDGWVKSSHRRVATCNDCHTPAGTVRKYLGKAENGLLHSLAFTSGQFHEPIALKPRNVAVTERACRGCHADVVHAIDARPGGRPLSCIGCHRSVGHLH
jgi:cytochrome c nitrite reductase small subunit